jgi:hypothetical protein
VSAHAPRFPPPVANRLQAPEGEVTVHVTPAERTKRESPFRWMLMAVEDQPVIAALILDAKSRLRFTRIVPGVGAMTAKTHVDKLMDERTWIVEMRWSEDEIEVSARAA